MVWAERGMEDERVGNLSVEMVFFAAGIAAAAPVW